MCVVWLISSTFLGWSRRLCVLISYFFNDIVIQLWFLQEMLKRAEELSISIQSLSNSIQSMSNSIQSMSSDLKTRQDELRQLLVHMARCKLVYLLVLTS